MSPFLISRDAVLKRFRYSFHFGELGYYITGVLTEAKIENNVHQVDRLERGVFRYLGLK